MPHVVQGPSVLDVHTSNKAENYIRIIAKTEPHQGQAVAELLEIIIDAEDKVLM